mmetsp:Transcript_10789/g.24652  ORF Transcript_10789/g.24652 Transcript_10789/m.24652 type:complete len:440 (+) Transcript_10789:55-1374(+)
MDRVETVYKPKAQRDKEGGGGGGVEAVALATPEAGSRSQVPPVVLTDAVDSGFGTTQRRFWVSPPSSEPLRHNAPTEGLPDMVDHASQRVPAASSYAGSGSSVPGYRDSDSAADGVGTAEGKPRSGSASQSNRRLEAAACPATASSSSSSRPARHAGQTPRQTRTPSASASRTGTPSKKASPSQTPRSNTASRPKRADPQTVSDFPVVGEGARLERQSENLVLQLKQSVELVHRLEAENQGLREEVQAQLRCLRNLDEILPQLLPLLHADLSDHANGNVTLPDMDLVSFSKAAASIPPKPVESGAELNKLKQELHQCRMENSQLQAEVQERDRVIAELTGKQQAQVAAAAGGRKVGSASIPAFVMARAGSTGCAGRAPQPSAASPLRSSSGNRKVEATNSWPSSIGAAPAGGGLSSRASSNSRSLWPSGPRLPSAMPST